jgi:hypothetical protein
MASPQIYIPGQARAPVFPMEHPGRKSRTTAAGWVLDYLVPRNQTVLLCQQCNHGFDGRKVNYFCLVQRFGYVRGTCDGCKKHWENTYMWVSESLIGTKSGQCWDSKYL